VLSFDHLIIAFVGRLRRRYDTGPAESGAGSAGIGALVLASSQIAGSEN
jgi:hypothetical protein